MRSTFFPKKRFHHRGAEDTEIPIFFICREIPANEKLSASGGCPWALIVGSPVKKYF
jgi:hypothetical protein